ncbi:transmembrane protein 182-like [Phyllopteryx taeniolatus]|uniref:transmembrane protein 182-like n=1 Tax=Phycodurus eques TaxID=693459 RepID=UPI002ACD7160|nr:transmembrane protein 182-like [Phycodurus eques]XP_061633055.1 transmembrane protein 182-like [Phyllopteryx taeniolatus]
MSERWHLSPNVRLSLLLFFALFFGALGVLSTLFSCATDYWLLGSAELCRPGSGSRQTEATDGVLFHEGLFWRCSFPATSPKYALWDVWILKGPHVKVCQPAFLFPFPAKDPFWVNSRDSPAEPYEYHTAIVFRTFWSIFLITGVAAVVTGGLSVICTASLSNHKLYKVGGVLLLCGGVCLFAVVLMFLIWVQVLDTLEEFAQGQRVSGCTSFHLSIQNGVSFFLAPVASFFSLLSGLLFIVIAQSARSLRSHRTDKMPQSPELQTDL